MTAELPMAPDLDDPLAWERRQPERYEYVGGIMRMMVGGTAAHHRVIANLATALRRRLSGAGCEVFTQTMKVRTSRSFAYPDAVLTSTEVDDDADVVEDAVVVVEVLSPSTTDHDRGSKWAEYQLLPALEAYVPVQRDRAEVEVYRRDGDAWRYQHRHGTDGTLALPHLAEPVPLAALWERVTLKG